MKAWEYEIGDVLLIQRKGAEVVIRVADYVDSLDNTTPLYCNLRVAGGLRWGTAKVKIGPDQIIKPLPEWYAEQKAKFDTSIKEAAERAYARMSPARKAQLVAQTERRRSRSPLDILIDKACGID